MIVSQVRNINEVIVVVFVAKYQRCAVSKGTWIVIEQ
jgi:hypothetical protein